MTATTVSPAASVVVTVVGAVKVENAGKEVPTKVSFHIDPPLDVATTVVAVWPTSNPQLLLDVPVWVQPTLRPDSREALSDRAPAAGAP